MTRLLIRNIGELCTCDPERGDAPGVIKDAAVLAIDGVITYAGPAGALPAMDGDAEELDADACAAVPGFVDSHTHMVWLGDRGGEYAERAGGRTYEDIAASGGGIRATVRATAQGTVEELAAAARTRLRAAAMHGTTTAEVKSGYGVEQAAEVRQLDAALSLRADPELPAIVTTYLPLHAPPPAERAAFLDTVRTDGVAVARSRATFVDAFCERGAYSVEECRAVFTAAQSAGLRVKVHAEQLSRSGGAQLAAALRAVSADHLDHAAQDDARALAAAGVTAVILPGASLVLGGPPPPGRMLIDSGVQLAIATDCNPGTCYSEAMPLMMSLAVASAGITPAEALVAATSGGAAALGLTDRGVIRAGMRCDLVLLNSPQWIDVAYHLGGDVVSTVVREGRVIWPLSGGGPSPAAV